MSRECSTLWPLELVTDAHMRAAEWCSRLRLKYVHLTFFSALNILFAVFFADFSIFEWIYRVFVATVAMRCDRRAGSNSNTVSTHTHTRIQFASSKSKQTPSCINRTDERINKTKNYFATLYAFVVVGVFMLLRARCVRSELNARAERWNKKDWVRARHTSRVQ